MAGFGVAHQLGASLAALTAGTIRTYLGDYRDASWLSGGLCLFAATLLISTSSKDVHAKSKPGLASIPAWWVCDERHATRRSTLLVAPAWDRRAMRFAQADKLRPDRMPAAKP
jgi:hypothetical protein